MSKTKNLLKRGNIFYGRIAVPNELRALRASVDEQRNPKEIIRSLETPDRKQAEYQLAKFKVEMREQFDRDTANLRSHGARPRTPPTILELARVREDFLIDELNRDEDERARRKSPAELDRMRATVLQRLEQSPSKPTTPLELLTAPGVLEFQVASEAAEWSSKKRRYLKDELQKHLAQSQYVLVVEFHLKLSHLAG